MTFIAAFIWLERYRCASSAIHWAYSLSNFINCSIANVFKVYKCSKVLSFIQFKNGEKERDGIYKNGVFYQNIYYYPNGRIERKHTYENSDQDSFFSEEYYESGRIKSKGKFVKAPDFATSHSYKPTGDFYYYDESGHHTIKNYDPKPVQPKETTPNVYRSNKRSSTWERGYSYGWDAGYEDAINGNGAWASYNESGKGGDFLDGYNSGYIDGYKMGRMIEMRMMKK